MARRSYGGPAPHESQPLRVTLVRARHAQRRWLEAWGPKAQGTFEAYRRMLLVPHEVHRGWRHGA